MFIERVARRVKSWLASAHGSEEHTLGQRDYDMKDSVSISDFLRKSDLNVIESELLDARMPARDIFAITGVLEKAMREKENVYISEKDVELLEKLEDSLTNAPLFYRDRIGKAVEWLENLSTEVAA